MEIFDQRTVILLDCHPDTRTVVLSGPEDSDKANCSIWSCFVEATLEYCRIIFDLSEVSASQTLVSVHVAGLPEGRNVLNKWDEQNLNQIANSFSYISPQSVAVSPLRMPIALENALISLEKSSSKNLKTVRFVLVIMGKGGNETGFNYHETREQKIPKDLRQMILTTIEKLEREQLKSFNSIIEHCHFDILRAIPPYGNMIDDIPRTMLTNKISISVYNISTMRDSLTRGMIHLAQIHRRLNCLYLYGIPMKKTSQNMKLTCEVEILYPAGHHIIFSDNRPEGLKKKRIFERGYLIERQTNVKWCKRKGYELDSLVTRCMHPITTLDSSHSPSSVLIQSLLSGSIKLFTTYSTQSGYDPTVAEEYLFPLTHMLSCLDGTLYLHCLSHSDEGNTLKNDLLNKTLPRELQSIVVTQKDYPESVLKEFDQVFIHPNILNFGYNESLLAQNTGTFPASGTGNNQFEKIEMVSTLSLPSSLKNVQSSYAWNWESRWWKSLLTKSGDNGMSAVKEETDILRNLKGLKNLICTPDPVDNFAEILNKILENLFATTKKGVGVGEFQNQKLANTLLMQVRTIANTFKSASTKHQEVCYSLMISVFLVAIESTGASNLESEVSLSWQQVDQYKNMTVREHQDFMDVSSSSSSSQSYASASQQQQSSTATTSNSSGRFNKSGYHPDYFFHKPRGGNAQATSGGGVGNRRGYQGKTGGIYTPNEELQQSSSSTSRIIPTPYLAYDQVTQRDVVLEREKYKNRLGDENCLFHQYWTYKKYKDDHDDGNDQEASRRRLFAARIPENSL
ncbi:7429_t:CDS:10 [Ambispora leptoticha]|uniref:7429_t:CDS:1 n=1 Tax=Ambispora leptoticha TaxID=144679 RepID=A0A9N8V971_9GLOM|nr:7429_t:CDS:10 [Ambispora leptoticha]